mmetsp:Transcript_41713/g.70380  ORF Transcript_41713/g.70380 Transcript_41713/m.70380 type:complete len:460 (+) Transcript_41713:1029-2408(+)
MDEGQIVGPAELVEHRDAGQMATWEDVFADEITGLAIRIVPLMRNCDDLHHQLTAGLQGPLSRPEKFAEILVPNGLHHLNADDAVKAAWRMMVKDVAVIADQDFDAVLESQALDSRVSLGLLLFGQRQTDPITLVVHHPTDGALTPATPDLQHRGAWFDVCRCQNCIQLAELGVVQLIPLVGAELRISLGAPEPLLLFSIIVPMYGRTVHHRLVHKSAEHIVALIIMGLDIGGTQLNGIPHQQQMLQPIPGVRTVVDRAQHPQILRKIVLVRNNHIAQPRSVGIGVEHICHERFSQGNVTPRKDLTEEAIVHDPQDGLKAAFWWPIRLLRSVGVDHTHLAGLDAGLHEVVEDLCCNKAERGWDRVGAVRDLPRRADPHGLRHGHGGQDAVFMEPVPRPGPTEPCPLLPLNRGQLFLGLHRLGVQHRVRQRPLPQNGGLGDRDMRVQGNEAVRSVLRQVL